MLVSLSRPCSGSQRLALLRHSPHVPPLLLQIAMMCLSAARHGSEWGLFSIPPAIYLTLGWLQVDEIDKAQSSDVCERSKAALPAGPPKELFSASISRYCDRN